MDTRYVLSKIVFIRKISTFHIYKLFHLSHSTISTKSSPCRKKIFSKFDPSIIINDRSNWKIKRDRWKGVELIGFGSLKGGLELSSNIPWNMYGRKGVCHYAVCNRFRVADARQNS